MNDTGFVGQPVPYQLGGDEWVMGILMFCFLVTSYVLSQDRTLLFQALRKLFSTRSFGHIFHKQTLVDTYCLLLLNLQTCLLVAVLLLKFYMDAWCSDSPVDVVSSAVPDVVSPLDINVIQSGVASLTEFDVHNLLGGYIAIAILYLLFKRYSYKLVNWAWFDKAKNNLWIDSYFFTESIFGMLLLPATLLIVYGDLPLYISVIIPVFLFLLMNLFFIYKCFSIFFSQLHGSCYLFLYFCTLEVLPLLVVWKGIEMVNDVLI